MMHPKIVCRYTYTPPHPFVDGRG